MSRLFPTLQVCTRDQDLADMTVKSSAHEVMAHSFVSGAVSPSCMTVMLGLPIVRYTSRPSCDATSC